MGVLEKPTWATVLLVLLHTSTGFTEKGDEISFTNKSFQNEFED